jgi:hypothetical protein
MSCNDDGAVELNLCLPKGADHKEVEWITDENDNPVDISGDTFRAEIRDFSGGTLIATFTFTVFLDNTEDPPFYKYQRFMDQDIINAITKTEGQWDQFRELASGDSERMYFGKNKFPGNITDPTK